MKKLKLKKRRNDGISECFTRTEYPDYNFDDLIRAMERAHEADAKRQNQPSIDGSSYLNSLLG